MKPQTLKISTLFDNKFLSYFKKKKKKIEIFCSPLMYGTCNDINNVLFITDKDNKQLDPCW